MALDNSNLSHVGIIGGMGPASTVRFIELVMNAYHEHLGAIQNSDFPQITLQTIPQSNHMTALPNREILSSLSRAVALFEYARVAFFVSPCNTVHQFLIHFDCGGLPLIHIVDAVRAHGGELLYQKNVLFLSTRQTLTSDMYAPMLNECNAKPVFLSDADQATLDEIIEGSNAGGKLEVLRLKLMQLMTAYEFDVALLACTELSLLLPLEQFICVGSLEALAQATYLVSSGQRAVRDYATAS